MQISVGELAKLLNGTVEGSAEILLNTVAKIEDGKEGALSFLANLKYEPYLYETKSSAVLVNHDFKPSKNVTATLIKVDNAYAAFTFLLEQFASQANRKQGIEEGSVIDKTANVGKDAYIGSLAYVGKNVTIGENSQIYPTSYIGDGVKIGKNCTIYAGVKIYYNCEIGDNVMIHAGTVIGSDGFGFAPLADKTYKKIPQIGNVIIEDDVEIGSNCCIDRATMGSTVIKKGAKLDNLIQIAHNVVVGEHTVIAGQAGIAGSSKIGKYCLIGAQVGIAGHLSVADGVMIGGQSGLGVSIKQENSKWFGSPAFDFGDSVKSSIIFKKLPQMYKTLNELEKKINEK